MLPMRMGFCRSRQRGVGGRTRLHPGVSGDSLRLPTNMTDTEKRIEHLEQQIPSFGYRTDRDVITSIPGLNTLRIISLLYPG